MKKLLKLLIIAAVLILPVSAHAYNVVNLPETMTLSDAMGIFDAEEIKRVTVSDIEDGRYTALTDSEIRDFYNTISDMRAKRTINPTPFRGIAVNIYTNDDEVRTYCINSGLQLGLYGSDNYICYKPSSTDTEKLLYLESLYWDSEDKAGGETIHRDVSHDFLKLPSAQWAKSFAQQAAAKSLIPYNFTAIYPNNISREQFCILLGNLIAVGENYRSLEDYMAYSGGAYLMNYFEDCAGKDNSINILHALGIVNGKDETHFDPDGELTREEAATLLCRVAERYMWIGTETNLTYEDTWLISDWAKFYVTWANEYGIMTGITEESFVPQGAYTVEQAIATMVRLYNLIY